MPGQQEEETTAPTSGASTNDAKGLSVAQIPLRNETAKYKIWRFKTMTRCSAVAVKGQTVDKVVAWVREINDKSVSYEGLMRAWTTSSTQRW